ncbi:ABC transporter ATP-binding protein [Rhizobium sp. NTR19]|uniref:ABC transporter ATP-binding protein n=1 Tax=Neorhizobium turbinariae TaxID=2937795 RepID=A0ABT0INQ2_9HYPH|nr:ABC transporter ATP-binding protein [Neorhizobium turbinariae]MCK8779507.1 ABC transporter ATP-binding protein [Neorhizobium turbinariae]
MNMPILSVRNIEKSFGGIRAVRDVSFDVQKGEILGLIGPNGSGKSTLFNCILGQLKPERGEVEVQGRNVSGLRASQLNKLGVGRTFQQLSVFPKMSVLDNIILAGQEHHGSMLSRLFGPGDAGLTEAAERLISFFRLDHLRDTLAGSLSYGQQKLVDAAMAFMAGPSLVLLDEPAGGVNLTMLAHLKERLVAYNAEHGTTFVVIEHNMEFVMSLCTRVIVLAEGEVIAEGTPAEIRANPQVIDAYLGGGA